MVTENKILKSIGINKKLKEKCFNISNGSDIGIMFVIAKEFGLSLSHFPDKLVSIMLDVTNGIYDKDEDILFDLFFSKDNDVSTLDNWIINEYRALFKIKNKMKTGTKKLVINKMRKFFLEHPWITKDDVILATKLHLSNTDPKYIKQADYFISKKTKSGYESILENMLELVIEGKQKQDGRNDHQNTIK